MMEQRASERYVLKMPVYAETMINEENFRSYKCKTRDVSHKGAFLLINDKSLKKGTDIKINLYLDSFSGSGSWVTMNGQVVRSESEGIGVSFDGNCQFINNKPYLDT